MGFPKLSRVSFCRRVAGLILAMVLIPSPGESLPFWYFDKLSSQSQAEFLAEMVSLTEQALQREGKPELAAKVDKLFRTIEPGDRDSLGQVELERNVAIARVADLKHLAKDPKAERLDVEDAWFVTLEKNHIPLSQNSIDAIVDAQARFHFLSCAQFAAMPLAGKQRFVHMMVEIGAPDFWFREEVNSKDHKPSFSKDVWGDLRLIMDTQFPDSQEQPGYAEAAEQIAEMGAEHPTQPAFGAVLIYLLTEGDKRAVGRIRSIEAHAVMLPDKRYVFPDDNGVFWFYPHGHQGKGEKVVKLEDKLQSLARGLQKCMESKNLFATEGLAACQDVPGVAEAPKNYWPPDDEDDPFGGDGGIIKPQ